MKVNGLHLLAKLEALAARTPSTTEHIDEMKLYVMKLLKQQFESYLIDIMWEDKQGRDVELRAAAMIESEKNDYESRAIYLDRGADPKSLTGWCYVNSTPVWIIDPDGLDPKKPYNNLFDDDAHIIPAGTIFEYNLKTKMKTEICMPLVSKISDRWTRTAGVLNIELAEVMRPSKRARELVKAAARIIEQLQNRQLTLKSAEDWSTREMRELRTIGNAFEQDVRSEPSLFVSAFVARPFGATGATEINGWIVSELESQGMRVAMIETENLISDEIWRRIRSCHFGVVVSTGYNANVLLEWGYLLGCGKPVILLHQEMGGTEKAPFNVVGVKYYPYATPGSQPTEEGVRKALSEGIRGMLKSNKELQDLLH